MPAVLLAWIGLPTCQTFTNWMKRHGVALPDRARRDAG